MIAPIFRECSLILSFLIDKHQAKGIAGFCCFPQGFNMELIVPGGLKDINPTCLHRRPCSVAMMT